MLRRIAAPLTAGVTYRRCVHLLLGAVVLLPYLGLAWLFVTSVDAGGLDPATTVVLLVVAAVVGVGVAFVPGVRGLEIAAARSLLDARVPEPDPATIDALPARGRAALWLLVVVVAGSLTALATLVVVPTSIGLLVAPWTPTPPLPTGWASAWAPVAAVALPVALLHLVATAGAGLARLAPRLLGPSPAERLAGELAQARSAATALAERARLARELHDSVGHALTITTVQAAAAARVLESDPTFVAGALEAIAEAGRAALADLDHVLGMLRDPTTVADRAPQPDLDDLDALIAGTRAAGVEVVAQVRGPRAAMPASVSREAYRIVQEALTNAVRHAGPVPVTVRVVTGTDLAVEIDNPVAPDRVAARPGHGRGCGRGRGLTGMRERVTALGGDLSVGATGGVWRVRARLPLTR